MSALLLRGGRSRWLPGSHVSSQEASADGAPTAPATDLRGQPGLRRRCIPCASRDSTSAHRRRSKRSELLTRLIRRTQRRACAAHPPYPSPTLLTISPRPPRRALHAARPAGLPPPPAPVLGSCSRAAGSAAPSPAQLVERLLADLPAWVRQPGFDRTVWLSEALQALWPHIEPGAAAALHSRLGAALQARAPLFLLSVSVSELTLGHAAPIVTSARYVASRGAVEVDFEARWRGDSGARSVIQLRTRFGHTLSATLSDFALPPTPMRLSLGPLGPALPGFGSASLSFLERPALRYRIQARPGSRRTERTERTERTARAAADGQRRGAARGCAQMGHTPCV